MSLESLKELLGKKVGEVVIVENSTSDEVRQYIKSDPNIKSTGYRVVETGAGIVTVVRTQGRVSTMKKALGDRINAMHPFERLHIEGYRLAYVRNFIRELKEAQGIEVHCASSIQEYEEGPEIIEIWKDPFTSWTSEEQNMQDMIKSFVKQTSDHFACGERDVVNQIELIFSGSTEEPAETADSTDEEE